LEKRVVLVVEDETVIRMETIQMLNDAGYAALGAPNTNDAMKILEGCRNIFARSLRKSRCLNTEWIWRVPLPSAGSPGRDVEYPEKLINSRLIGAISQVPMMAHKLPPHCARSACHT
jgi:hypothetical protein